jgi:hypothetical protein
MLLMAFVFVLLPAVAMLAAWLLAPHRPHDEDAPLLRFLFVFAGFLLGADAGFFTAGLIADSEGLGERAFGAVMLATLAVAAIAAILADALFVRRLASRHA